MKMERLWVMRLSGEMHIKVMKNDQLKVVQDINRTIDQTEAPMAWLYEGSTHI